MVWRASDPCGEESRKVMWELPQYTRGRGLDLGCGPEKVFPHAIGVDNYTDTRIFGIQMKPDVVCDCTKLDVFGSASMDWAFSSHLLEHIPYDDVSKTLGEWLRVVKQNGYLILYLPDEDEYPKVGEPHANIDHKWNVSYDRVIDAMKQAGSWDLIRYEKRDQGQEYSLFFVFKKLSQPKTHRFSFKDQVKPEKICGIVRYGGWGDMIMASSVLPLLKAEGYAITLYCTPRGKDVLEHDPHIDAFYVQDTDQIPNHMLPDFWAHESKKFDKWVNLSESVEGTWLALPGRTNHSWPIPVRQKYLNVNYLEYTHDLAGVPFKPKPMFYATPEEKAWAKKERQKFGGDSLIMYSLAGSSVHKVWPHMDTLLARIMLRYPSARVVTVGDALAQMLEHGWENEARVVKKSGKYTIRETLALIAECDMVIGPETGVLNAASHMSVQKIVMLSHSSHENLTKHWVNTNVIEPRGTSCFPCHAMVYSFADCNRDETTGVAKCASDTSVEDVWSAFEHHMRKVA